jgi:hypothetical protein
MISLAMIFNLLAAALGLLVLKPRPEHRLPATTLETP